MEKILVSSCLLGARVRHDGSSKALEDGILATWRAEGRLLALCPEMAVGLPTPRPSVEIAPGATAAEVLNSHASMYDKDGLDMTREMVQGADIALETAQAENCRFALLTDGSPSCGSTFVHAGHFDGQHVSGEGVVSARLRAAGVQVFAHSQLRDLVSAVEEAENN